MSVQSRGASWPRWVPVALVVVLTLIEMCRWGLAQLLHGDAVGKPERLDNGLKWRFRIKLDDRQQSLSGNATFEAVLKRPLPKMEEWPN